MFPLLPHFVVRKRQNENYCTSLLMCGVSKSWIHRSREEKDSYQAERWGSRESSRQGTNLHAQGMNELQGVNAQRSEDVGGWRTTGVALCMGSS